MNDWDDLTEHHSLPLPNPERPLDEDVMRLREALVRIDRELDELDTLNLLIGGD